MKESSVKVTFAGGPLTLLGNEIKVGDLAPDFTAVGPGLSSVKLSDFAGKFILLLTQVFVHHRIESLMLKPIILMM